MLTPYIQVLLTKYLYIYFDMPFVIHLIGVAHELISAAGGSKKPFVPGVFS